MTALIMIIQSFVTGLVIHIDQQDKIALEVSAKVASVNMQKSNL